MLTTDPLVEVVAHALNVAKEVPAQNVHVILSGKLVAKFLHLNRGLSITLVPQQVNALAKDGDTRMLYLCRLHGCRDDVAKGSHKQRWIGFAISHENGEHVKRRRERDSDPAQQLCLRRTSVI